MSSPYFNHFYIRFCILQLWETRISAGCEQFGIEREAFQEGIVRNNILLNRKVLADLAAWEPQTFEAITKIGRETAVRDNLNGVQEPTTDNRVFVPEKQLLYWKSLKINLQHKRIVLFNSLP